MFAWLSENAVTLTAVAILLAAVGGAVFSLIKGKHKCGGCTGNCASCKAGCSCNKR